VEPFAFHDSADPFRIVQDFLAEILRERKNMCLTEQKNIILLNNRFSTAFRELCSMKKITLKFTLRFTQRLRVFGCVNGVE